MATDPHTVPISLTARQVIDVLQGIGLGAKLINQALPALGFQLKPFPTKHRHLAADWPGVSPTEENSADSENDKDHA